ncbi:MAG: hypothetical protein ABSE73_18885, partial [Planctomycetota bacterium]
PHGVDQPAAAGDLPLEAMLLTLPCELQGEDLRVSGMVTQIVRAEEQGARFVLQLERPVPTGRKVTLVWRVPEKPSLPSVEGEIEKFFEPPKSEGEAAAAPKFSPATTPKTPLAAAPKVPPAATPKVPPALLRTSLLPGSLVLNVKALPPEIIEWRPGLLIPSDLKTPEEIVRL